jgi:hypothetical protein
MSFLDNLMPTNDHAQALMMLAQGLAKRDFTTGALNGMQHLAAAPMREQERKLADMRMQEAEMRMAEMKRKLADNDALMGAARDAFRTPEQAAAMSVGPTMDGGTVQYKPGFDNRMFIDRVRMVNPLMAQEMESKLKKDPIKVGAGDSILDPDTLQPLYSAPAKAAEQPSAVREYEYAKQGGFQGSFEDWVTKGKQASAPRVSVDLRDPTAVARTGMEIQDKVRAAFKPHYTVADQYNAMLTAVKNPSPQGDTALLYSFFKVLDPDSTVREGELDLVMSNRSLPDRVKGYAQKLAGGGSLMPHERQDLLTQGKAQVQARMPRARKDLQAYRENVQRMQLDPELYAPDPYSGLRFDGEAAAPAGKAQWK